MNQNKHVDEDLYGGVNPGQEIHTLQGLHTKLMIYISNKLPICIICEYTKEKLPSECQSSRKFDHYHRQCIDNQFNLQELQEQRLHDYHLKYFKMNTIEFFLEQWHFTFHQSGLAPSQEIQSLAEECKLFRPPTIIFSKNQCIIKERQAGIAITYNAREALRFINYQQRQESYVPPSGQPQPNTISYIPQKLYVKHAQHWKSIQKPKDIEITEIHQSSDSFFLNTFKGHIDGKVKVQRVFDNVIPLEKLGPTNPIAFYFQGSMYQDELDDNGLIQYQYKFRTMSQSWFGLIRNYARIDDVAVLIYDTRIYWQKGWSKIARQFMVKRASWEQLKNKEFQFPPGWTMNPNQSHIVYPFLNEVFVENQIVHFA